MKTSQSYATAAQIQYCSFSCAYKTQPYVPVMLICIVRQSSEAYKHNTVTWQLFLMAS